MHDQSQVWLLDSMQDCVKPFAIIDHSLTMHPLHKADEPPLFEAAAST
jgi:hypothetical protein